MRRRVIALAAAIGILAIGLGIRGLGGAGAVAQHSGTALYAVLIYAGVFVLAPATRPLVAGAVAIGFCWLVEFSQLTGVPAALSERSLVARLVLGAQFDAKDLLWYVIGVVPLAAVHHLLAARRATMA